MSGFLVAEKNSSETDNTASHPTLERTIVSMNPNLSVFFFHTSSQGSTNNKTDHKTGKLQVMIIDLGPHPFLIKTDYLQRHQEHLTTPWRLHRVLESNMASWVINMQEVQFFTKVTSSRDATLL